jgi:thiosulfate sulfurtransferase
MSIITVPELALWQRAGFDFELLDVRRLRARAEDGSHIAGDRWLDPAAWLDWKDTIGHDRPVVVYCAHGHEISQGCAQRCGRWGPTPATSTAASAAGKAPASRCCATRNQEPDHEVDHP